MPFRPIKLQIDIPGPGTLPGPGYEPALEKALCLELESILPDLQEGVITSFLLRGGTSLPDQQMGDLLRTLHQKIDLSQAEKVVTVEPDQLSTALLTTLRNFHMDLYQMDLGSLNIVDFKTLGRGYAYHLNSMLSSLFHAFQMDEVCPVLYHGIPGQNEASMRDSLIRVLSLTPHQPDRILFSAYRSQSGQAGSVPTKDLLAVAGSFLEGEGYHRIKEGDYRKNVDTLEPEGDRDVFGIGPGAVTILDGYRMQNTSSVERYLVFSGTPADLIVKIERADA